MPNFDVEVDATGLTCPMPVMKCKKTLQTMLKGQVLHLMATDPGSKEDVPTLVEQTGNQLLELREDGATIHYLIKKVA